MYKCNNCNARFKIPSFFKDCLSDPFNLVQCVCPDCGSPDLDTVLVCPRCEKEYSPVRDVPLCPDCERAVLKLAQDFLKGLSDPQVEVLDHWLDGESVFNLLDLELKDGV